MNKLSKLQKAILKVGLRSLWYEEPIQTAMCTGRNKWSANPTFRIPIPLGGRAGDYKPSQYIGFDLTDLLLNYFKVTTKEEIWYTSLTSRTGSDRRKRFAKGKASLSRAIARLVSRGLVYKTSYRKWKLTPVGEQVASLLYPDTRKATKEEIEESYQEGVKGPGAWRPK